MSENGAARAFVSVGVARALVDTLPRELLTPRQFFTFL